MQKLPYSPNRSAELNHPFIHFVRGNAKGNLKNQFDEYIKKGSRSDILPRDNCACRDVVTSAIDTYFQMKI